MGVWRWWRLGVRRRVRACDCFRMENIYSGWKLKGSDVQQAILWQEKLKGIAIFLSSIRSASEEEGNVADCDAPGGKLMDLVV
jgi:hypothetical protein